MKIVVLGAGVIGVTTAYYLLKAGHQVTVVDRQSGPALETSFANAGEISTGHASPWARPGVPLLAIKWLLMKHGPLAISLGLDVRLWGWLARVLRNCTAARYVVNKSRLIRLAEYSRDCLCTLRAETSIVYDERSLGTLQLFRTSAQVDAAARDIAVLKQYHVRHELLDAAGCVACEPGLRTAVGKIAGGLRLLDDETGDCHLFTRNLAGLAARLGAEFRYDTAIEGIVADGLKVSAVATSAGRLTGDAYVVALGSDSPLLLDRIGIAIPVYPVKGYSLTLPLVDAGAAPVSTVMDESYKIAITRLGDRIRVGGTAELAGYDLALPPERRTPLLHSLLDLFPGAGDLERASFWCGLRPMTPDGVPIIGAARYANLFLNTGHGTLGWTLSCGSARLLADTICGRKTEIDTAGLNPSRYH